MTRNNARTKLTALALCLVTMGPGVARAGEGDDGDDVEIEATPVPATAPAAAPMPTASAPATSAPEAVAAPPPVPAATAPTPAAAPVPPPPASPEATGEAHSSTRAHWLGALDLHVSGYVQGQFISNQQSEDEVSSDGGALNQDRFMVRRARLKVERSFRFAHTDIEIDANTVRGPALDLRHAEVLFFLPQRLETQPPLVGVLAGLSDVPFGAELTQGSRGRIFMERTLASRAFFAGEPDIGVQLLGALGPFRYALAAVNGEPVGDNPATTTLPFASEKTFVGRLGAATGKTDKVSFAGGVSYLGGTGFHAGNAATKSTLTWSDANEDGFVTLDELAGNSGQAATASSTFARWAFDADLSLGVRSPLGWTVVTGEATVASNLDRTYFVADPVSTGYDIRELGWSAGATQEVTRWGILGFRADSYNPSSDLFDARRGEFIPENATVLTLSPLVGGQVPGLGRLVVQYDYIVDHLGRDVTGQPIDLPNDQWTVRLQGEF